MKISVFGMGYVGAVTSACLARDGHEVTGVDISQTKVDLINSGATPIVEKSLGEMMRDGVESGRLKATTDARAAVMDTELSMVCVGTPSQINGSLDLSYVRRVCEQIGEVIGEKQSFHVVVARSTMLPGTMAQTVIPTLESSSGKKAGEGFGVCNNPEFLREGTAIFDYDNPPKTVIGTSDDSTTASVSSLYSHLPAEIIATDVYTAEMVKYADNTWHALKVAFANEVGAICKAIEIDSHKVMEIFCKDTKLNLSPYYLKPGFAFGGSCLPKDVRALAYKGRSLDLNLPLMESIMPSNEAQIRRGIDLIERTGKRRLGILGFSFKAGTDDLRESPIVTLIEYFIGKGYDLKLYDKNVSVAALVGANKDYILNTIPHISGLMESEMGPVLEHSEVLVIGNGGKEFAQVPDNVRDDQTVIDLVRITADASSDEQYQGLAW